jgi:heme-degrading monooxygenase HmoA
MYATIIRFAAPRDVDWEELRQSAIRRAFEVFRHVPGLRAKAFVLSPGKGEFGGNYVWETQDDAQAYLRSDLFRALARAFGEPRVEEGAEICAYLEDGDLLFPPDYEATSALGPEAEGPPPGL